jgi:hypothetical protein
MQLKFKDVINKHKGKKCIVVGHGPSLNSYLDKLSLYKKNDYIIIGCNNWDEFYIDTPPHYWVNANNQDDTKVFLKNINTYKPIWVYADSVDLTDYSWIDENIKTDYLPYDQRHFYGKKCYLCENGCGKNFNSQRLTIQEELQKYTGFEKAYGAGHTVALHMLSLSILLGFSEIYVVGLDFDYHKGYAKNSTNRPTPEVNYFDINKYGHEVLKDVEIIGDSAKKIGTKMYNLNKESNWKFLEFKDLPPL